MKAIVIASALFFSLANNAIAKSIEPAFWEVNSDHVINLYEKNKLNATILGVIPPKAQGLKNLGCKTNGKDQFEQLWCKVEYQDKTGWVEARYLSKFEKQPTKIVNNEFSLNCDKVEYSADKTVCDDSNLKKLNETMNEVFAQAIKAAKQSDDPSHLDTLLATQKNWVKNKNECWKSGEGLAPCVKRLYENRISELQVQWNLIAPIAANFFICEDDTELFITEYGTQLPTAIIEYQGEKTFLVATPTASGTKYGEQDRYIWLKGNDAIFVWEKYKPIQQCTVKQS